MARSLWLHMGSGSTLVPRHTYGLGIPAHTGHLGFSTLKYPGGVLLHCFEPSAARLADQTLTLLISGWPGFSALNDPGHSGQGWLLLIQGPDSEPGDDQRAAICCQDGATGCFAPAGNLAALH